MIIISYKKGQKFTATQAAIINHCIKYRRDFYQAVWDCNRCCIIPNMRTLPYNKIAWVDFFKREYPEFGIELKETQRIYYRLTVNKRDFIYPLPHIKPEVFRQYEKNKIGPCLLKELHKKSGLQEYGRGSFLKKGFDNVPKDGGTYIPIWNNEEKSLYILVKVTDELLPYMEE